MPEQRNAADEIVTLWLGHDELTDAEVRDRIVEIRREYQQTHPGQAYGSVVLQAYEKLEQIRHGEIHDER